MSAPRNILILALGCCLPLAACSRYEAANIVLSKDPAQAARYALRHRGDIYKRNPLKLAQDIKAAKRNLDQLAALLRKNVDKEWGSDEVFTPTRTRYVKYTQNYRSRAIVNFDSGLVTIETLDQAQALTSLRNAIVTTLLTPDDPRAVDLYSDKIITLSGTPYLYGLVIDHHDRPIGTPRAAESYADYLAVNHIQTRTVTTAHGAKTVRYVRLRMVNDYLNRAALRYAHLVERHARRFGVSKSLVYAVIKTESNFNPFAVSSAPAYGLMQLVPTSGGRDAYGRLKGVDGIPSREYLFNPDNNIELGTAYLSIISGAYLDGIQNPVSREYCTIAAYNGGSGSVLKVFSPNRTQAIRVINGLHPSEVYKRLKSRLARHETRRYLVKVISARRDFVNI